MSTNNFHVYFVVFCRANSEKSDEIKSKLLSTLYGCSKDVEDKRKTKSLKKLVTKSMDDESIWQQLELQNDENFQTNLKNVSKFLAVNTEKFQLHLDDIEGADSSNQGDNSDEDENEELEEEGEEEQSDESGGSENEEGSEIDEEDDELEAEPQTISKVKSKKSIVDDKFFKLHDMEEFLINEENRDAKSRGGDNDEEIDLFQDDTNREESMKYSDFFDSINVDTSRNTREDEGPTEEPINAPKSSFELQQERLKKKINHMENALLDEKPWQMKGEVKGDSRPQNSLLEEVLEFDSTTRPAPVITEAVTLKLEDIIRQRIKDKIYEDVERKVKPSDLQMEYKKQLVLDQEKSKLSLAQLYEKEYIKELEKNNPDAQDEPEEQKEHKEIRAELKSLFEKLDLLSNFYYTPRPAAAELKIITNLPTIAMEEVAPVSTSNATFLAPEEVRRKSRGDVMGTSERTETDKNRERRHKKKFQQKKFNKETVRGKSLADKVVKSKNVEKMQVGTSMKSSSTAFFSKLQDDIAMKKNNEKPTKRKGEKSNQNAKKLKL